jgi:ribosomal protein S2
MTNFETIRLRIGRLKELDEMKRTGEIYRRPKKELAVLNRELYTLEKSLGGIKNMRGRPDVLFVIDQKRELIAITEATKIGTSVVGMIDTNGDPEGIGYVIPANDDSIRSIKLVTSRLADAILEGKGPLGTSDSTSGPFPGDGPDLQPSGVPKKPLPHAGSTALSLALPEPEDEIENPRSWR